MADTYANETFELHQQLQQPKAGNGDKFVNFPAPYENYKQMHSMV